MLKKVKALLPVLLIAALPAQARAGHGTIRETDTQIIIEYTGDANDKPAEPSGPQRQAPPPPASAQPPAGQGAMDGSAVKAQQEGARAKQEEAKAAAGNGEQRAVPSSRRSRGASNNQE